MTKIIIVEDDPMIAEIYQRKFGEAGFEVETATSGKQVLDMAKEKKADIILLDLLMPQMNGFEVLEKLRSGEYDPNIKIIIFSNMSQNEDKAKALQLGANGFIVKSDYTPSQLVEEIKRFLNQYSEQQKNEVRINGNGGTPATAPANGSKKILMIEDEEVFIEMFGEKLKQDGYEMTFARNGAWGVKEALKGDFNLFIIDMVMPAMTGEEMVAKIKMEEKTKSVPILVLSASVEDETAKRVEAMGINGFFIKTQITPSDLAKKVEEIIGH